MKSLIKLSAVVFLCLINSAFATKFSAPENREIKSSNGKYLLHVNAKSGLHELRKGTDVIWSFNREVEHDEYFVSNDGAFVLWVSSRFVKEENAKAPALKVYAKRGAFLAKTFAELGTPRACRKDDVGPVGEFWRIWRGDITREGEVISIEVEGSEKPYQIDFLKIKDIPIIID